MKRLALVLAAGLLGTGCIVTDDHDCDFRDVLVTWSGFTGPDAVRNRPCGTQVPWVDLFIDGARVEGPFGGHFDCNEYGVNIVGVGRGSHVLTAEGLAVDEGILFRDERSFSSSGCGNIALGVEPAAGYVDIEYLFFDGPTQLPPANQVCAGENLWLSIRDVTAGFAAVLSDRTFDPEANFCGDPAGLSFILPSGPYSLDWMEERGPATAYVLESADCTPFAFTVPAGGAVAVPANLDTTALDACVRP